MRTKICEMVGCEVPIFTFSHCRDVVVEVTKAGGFGVLGAATFSPAQLQAELRWIDEHVVGQSVGDVNSETMVREVMYRLQVEYVEAMERLTALQNAE
jgi:hypothetical protein